ncbi:MAG: hypothetical protein VX498_02350, partial [Myxococcota bacterium]|nr:hypothetical protein [Myxococcota bacterium]
AWLPLRAAAVPSASWGVPDTMARFLDVILARNFARNFGGNESSLVENLGILGQVWASELLPVLLLVALWVGLSRRTTARPMLAWAGVALLWLLGNALTVLPQNKVFPTNPDLLGYLFVGLLALVPVLFSALRTMGRIGLVLAALVFVAQLGSGNVASQSSNHLARSFATAQSVGLPTGAILMTSGNDTAFVWSYLQRVERRRTDLVLLHRVLLGHEHELRRLGGTEELAALGIPWSSDLRAEPGRFMEAFRRPFFVERREAEQGFVERGELRRYGLVASRGAVEEPWLAGLRERTLVEFEQERYRLDPEARLVLAYYRDLWGEAR